MAVETSPGRPAPTTGETRGRTRRPRLLIALGAVAVAVGCALRFYAPTPLWLDETISVNIARLPLGQIHGALRQDGAPPLYYLLLHFWMRLFGQGDVAVRALSGVISVLTLPVFWLAGRRLGGPTVAWVTFFLGLTSPFAIEYATATRMYSLMVLWCLVGFLALSGALADPRPRRLAGVAAVTAALLYTHYWALYLLGVTGLWLLYQLWRARRGLATPFPARAVRRCVVAVVVGGLTFIPWAPTFVFQSLHTGTPWGALPGPDDLLAIFNDYAGTGPWAAALALGYFALVVLGVFGRRPRPHEIAALRAAAGEAVWPAGVDGPPAADLPTAGPVAGADGDSVALAAEVDGADRPGVAVRLRRLADRVVGFAGFGPGGAGAAARRAGPGRGITLVLAPNRRTLPVFAVLLGTLTVAVAAGALASATFSARYASAVLPLFLMVVAVGISVLGRRPVVAAAVAGLCVAGLLTAYGNNQDQRTEAGLVATVLTAQARPGDLVIYCPDQLGPAVSRLFAMRGVTQITYPRAIGPDRVDWIDYERALAETDPQTFAQDALARVGADATVWLVWARGYIGLGSACSDLQTWLAFDQGAGTTLVTQQPSYYEHEMLTRFAPSSESSTAPVGASDAAGVTGS